VLGQADSQVVGTPGEHAPHRSGRLIAQLTEHRVAKADVRRIAGRHGVAVAPRKGGIEALDQLALCCGHDSDPIQSSTRSGGGTSWAHAEDTLTA